jgi:hypothetical protein
MLTGNGNHHHFHPHFIPQLNVVYPNHILNHRIGYRRCPFGDGMYVSNNFWGSESWLIPFQ